MNALLLLAATISARSATMRARRAKRQPDNPGPGGRIKQQQ